MGFLKGFIDKAKEKASEIKNNVSKQDLMDLVSDVQKTIADGGDNEATRYKAMGQFAMGLGKMATGKYEGSSRKLDSIHKDPHDIQMAEETKDELNVIIAEMLNPRKFIYESPDTINELGIFVVENIPFVNGSKDTSYLSIIHAHFKENGIHYDAQLLETSVKNLFSNKDAMHLLSIRHQVDKYIFIDRMTKDEIVAMYEKFKYNMTTHYKYKCEYCRRQFVKRPGPGEHCPLSVPMNSMEPWKAHKIVPIDE